MYYGSAQEFITEGSNLPAAADVDGDGDDEIAVNPLFSPAYLLDGDGSVRASYGAQPVIDPASAPSLDEIQSALPGDVPVGFTTSGAFGRFGPLGALSYAQAASGAASVAGSLLYTGSGIQLRNYQRAVDALTGAPLPGFPAALQGLNFLGAPLFVDVTGDGAAEIVDGGDSQALHAYDALGAQAAGFPKFTSGWVLTSPSAGDLDGDGLVEIVANTREGYVMVWRTPGLASANDQWWHARHDEWHSGRHGTDTRPPGVLRELAVDAATRTLSFKAPGDDWYQGRVSQYRLLDERGATQLEWPATQEAGSVESLALPDGLSRGFAQALDEAGNAGRRAGFALSGTPPPVLPPGGEARPTPAPGPASPDQARFGGALDGALLWGLLAMLGLRGRRVTLG